MSTDEEREQLLRECGCDFFEPAYPKCHGNRSNNYKDAAGRSVWRRAATAVTLFAGAAAGYVWGSPSLSVTMMAVAGSLTFSVLASVYRDPMNVVYAASAQIEEVVRTPPVMDVEMFPEHRDFEEQYDALRAEVATVGEHMDKLPLARDTFDGENSQIGRDVRLDENGAPVGWRIMMVLCGNTFSPDALRYCPKLCALLRTHRAKIKSCAISILPQKTCIPQHIGYYKGVMRYMLAIEVPKDRENVYLCVNNERVLWEEGRSILFDDTYPHKVYNRTDERRIVLYMDVKREGLGLWRDTLNETMIRLITGSSIAQAEVKKTEVLTALE